MLRQPMCFVHVEMSPSRPLFVTSRNLATTQCGRRFFVCLCTAPEGLGSESSYKCWTWGSVFLHESLWQSHKLLHSGKVKIQDPSVGFLFSTVAPKWAVLTLNLCAQDYAQVSHLHVLYQNSTSTCSSIAYKEMSCSMQLLRARTEQYLSGSKVNFLMPFRWVTWAWIDFLSHA